ncbi:MAG: hypothetical protein J0I12_23560 [Candidatus Eremiobacteraeota bacterium]|nr:hypothetical protein [Candidatus Eremiobacteraeota bacterium]
MQFGKLTFRAVVDEPDLVAQPIRDQIAAGAWREGVYASEIDSTLADTAAFCQAYEVAPESGANCIIVEARGADGPFFAACLVLASTQIDVNNKVKRALDAKKVSFAPREAALQLSAMEFGGVTPIGLPADLPILIDEKVLSQEYVIIGSGLRRSKILAHTQVLAGLSGARVLEITK